jgi:signal transduction histidine kinase
VPRRGDSEDVQRAARRAGVRDGPLTLATAEHRRRRLWLLALGAIVVTCGAAVIVAEIDDSADATVWPLWVAVAATVVFAVADVLVNERRLDRLTRLLVDERIALGVEASRAGELRALAEAGRAVNADLDLAAALDIILARALELVAGDSGSMMLVDGARLRVVCAHNEPDAVGATVAFGEGVAGRVAAERQAMLISGLPDRDRFDLLADRRVPLESAMSIPLVHRDELIGVLNVNAPADRRFTEHDLTLVSVLADHAAAAIANARAAADDARVAADLAAAQGLVDATAHALGAVVVPAVRAAPGLAVPGETGQAWRRVERDLRALSLVLAPAAPAVATGTVDVSAVVSAVTGGAAAAGRTVAVRGVTQPVLAFGAATVLEEILEQMVDNAFTHGRPPVEIEVDAIGTADGGSVRITVLDRGRGFRGGAPTRFEPFSASANGGLGLGLSVVRRLAEAQGGSVAARSRTGGGAAVSVVLPAPPVS